MIFQLDYNYHLISYNKILIMMILLDKFKQKTSFFNSHKISKKINNKAVLYKLLRLIIN